MVILLADDEPIVLETLGQFLANCGHEVVFAEDGQGAISRLEERKDIGLVLSDVRMPEIDGLALLHSIRLEYPGIPVVLITGHGDMETAVAALQKGAYDFIRKPVKLDELMVLVERVEQRRRLESTLMQERAGLVHAGPLGMLRSAGAGIAQGLEDAGAAVGSNLEALCRLWTQVEPTLGRYAAASADGDLAVLLDEVPRLAAEMLSGIQRITTLARQMVRCCAVVWAPLSSTPADGTQPEGRLPPAAHGGEAANAPELQAAH